MIVGIGELLWDVFPDGRKVAGGAPFNFAFHCQQLGHEAVIVSRVGDDDLGRELRDEVKRLGLSDEFIQTDHEHSTGTVQVSVDAQGQPTYTITENVAWDFIEWGDRLASLAERAKAVCFGTLAQRSPHSMTTIQNLVSEAQGLKVIDVNVRPMEDELLLWRLVEEYARKCDWFKLSLEDALSLLRMYCMEIDEQPNSPIRYFFSPDADPRKLGILTRGEKGCEVIDWQRNYHERGVEANVVDTVGAGDAFMAAFLCSHLEGRPLKTTMRFALHYAARVCEFPGGTPLIDRDEVELRLLDDPWMRES